MPTPKSGYYVDGVKVPSVTTIINRFKQSEDLIGWAYRCGKEGKDFREERDRALSVGNCVHSAIDYAISGETIPKTIAYENGVREQDVQEARNGFAAWQEWRKVNNPTFEETEVGLTSTKHRFGGTFDAVCLIGGKRVLMDWKTSRRAYNDFRMQVFAYILLWSENRQTPIDAAGILRLDKKTGKYEEHIIDNNCESEKYITAFLSLRTAYDSLSNAGLLYDQRKKNV